MVIGCIKELNNYLMSTNIKKKLNLHTFRHFTLQGTVGNKRVTFLL